MLGTPADNNLSLSQKNLCSSAGLGLDPCNKVVLSHMLGTNFRAQDKRLPTAAHPFFFKSRLADSWLMTRQGVITQANEYTCWEASIKQTH